MGGNQSGRARGGDLAHPSPSGALRLPVRRLVSAFGRIPSRAGWLEVCLLTAGFAVVAFPLAFRAGLLEQTWQLSPALTALLAARVLIAPALIEELAFRVLPNPHPTEGASTAACWRAGVVSLSLYVLAHPLAALLVPAARPVLAAPVFLLLAALLGVTCLISYRRTGSLWAPVAVHWLVVVVWLSLGGRGVLAAAGA